MTKKKENILNTALHLFSAEGFSSISTARIAKDAGVSEGLIFRHFTNKEGLLNAIIELGKERSFQIFEKIIEIKNPQVRLKHILSVPFSIDESEHSFWKLLYQLKWHAKTYDEKLTVQLKQLIAATLNELNFDNIELEVELALMLFDGMATAVLLKNFKKTEEIQNLIYKKYNL